MDVKGNYLARSCSRRSDRRTSRVFGVLGSYTVNARAIEAAIQADIDRGEAKRVVGYLASIQESTEIRVMHMIVAAMEALDIITAAKLLRRDAAGSLECSVLGGRRVRGRRCTSQKGARQCGETREGEW